MHVEQTEIYGLLVITPRKVGDDRGFFSETFNAGQLSAHGVASDWVQDNHVWSRARGVVRGLHFQAPPFAQAKLIRVTLGAIYDVVVDLRGGSPTYGRHFGVELSAENWKQLYIPAGFAHGYCTLTESSETLYKVSGVWNSASEAGLRWCDRDLGISWPISQSEALLSERDKTWPSFAEFVTPF
jgi:dTDP-4-dehydrorhamnose 3,5-epimerase